MNILAGYGLLLAYFLVIFFVAGWLIKKFFGVAVSRKAIHIFVGFAWFIYDQFFGNSYHGMIICGALLLVAILSKKFHLIKSIENDKSNSNGTIYYASALFVLFLIGYLVPDLYPYVGFAVIILSVGDGAAMLFGRFIKSIKIYHEKTLIGFLSCIALTFGSIALYNFFYFNAFSWIQLILIAILAGIFEEEDLNGFDNITISLFSFGVMALIKYVPEVDVTIAIFIALFIVCFFLKVMTYHGSLASSLIGAAFYKIAGWQIFVFIMSCYVLLIGIHFLRKVLKVKNKDIVKKQKGKDLMQVAANGLIALIFLIIFAITKNNKLLVMSLLVFTNSFVDSIASDIGSMSKKKPYDIFKHKFVDQGQSGGVSVLGTVSSFIASCIFAVCIWLLTNCNPLMMIVFAISMNICCFVDTMFGSLFQVKYKCDVCGLITEKEEHCGQKTTVYSGIKIFNNDTVNLTCSFICGCLSTILFAL